MKSNIVYIKYIQYYFSSTAKETSREYQHQQLQRPAHLRADRPADQKPDHPGETERGGSAALHAASGKRTSDQRHHHQAGL